jgi:preprotein translocase subunit SecF
VVRSFTAAMIWGIFVATASSIFIGGPILVYFNIRPRPEKAKPEKSGADTADTTAAGA